MAKAIVILEGFATKFSPTFNRGCEETKHFAIESSRRINENAGISIAYNPKQIDNANITAAVGFLFELMSK